MKQEKGGGAMMGESHVVEEFLAEKMWHLRLGNENMKKMLNKQMVNGLKPKGRFEGFMLLVRVA